MTLLVLYSENRAHLLALLVGIVYGFTLPHTVWRRTKLSLSQIWEGRKPNMHSTGRSEDYIESTTCLIERG